MDQTNEAGDAGSEQPPIATHSTAGDGPITARQAANSLVDWRRKNAATSDPAESATPATAGQESAIAADAAPPQEVPGETEGQGEPEAQLPPIDPPRSWTKDEKDRFQSLPRETQEYIASREQDREREVRRSQNDHAEKLKGLTAKEQAVEQARQQYESALPILLQSLSATYNAEFSDIQTIQDVQRLAKEDPFRYSQWDAQQKQFAAVQQEVNAAHQRQTAERQQKLNEFMRRETELFAEKVPEIADEAQRAKLQSSAVSILKDLGFKEEELATYWRGEKDISIHDHRLQLLIRDSIKLREMQEKARTIRAEPKPPVQRPGVPQGKNALREANLATLSKQVESTSGLTQIRAAAKLIAERRRGA